MGKKSYISQLADFVADNHPNFYHSDEIAREQDLFMELEEGNGQNFNEWCELFCKTILISINENKK